MQSVEVYEHGNGVSPAAKEDSDSFPRTLDIVIDPPIEFGGKTYDSLHLEEPTAKQVRVAEVEFVGDYGPQHFRNFQVALISQVSNVPRGAIEDMRISQLLEAYAFLRHYSGHGPAIGQI
jgi:Phage tail assembly chaperone proteins, E, or 41 or 14